MPSKTTSPEAAQKKLWRAELKQLTASRTKVAKDIDAECKRSYKQAQAARKAADQEQKRHVKNVARLERLEARQLADIERRIGFLKGRIGI